MAAMSEEISPMFRDVVRLTAILMMGRSPFGNYMVDDDTLMERLKEMRLAEFFERHWEQTFRNMEYAKSKITTKRDGFNVLLQSLFEFE